VFISVTALFSCSVTVAEPLAYEPPTIEIFAECAVTETRWKSGWIDGSVELASGKSLPTATEYSVPLTEITAVPGVGALALRPSDDEPPLPPLEEPPDDPPAEPPDDEDEDDASELSLICWAKGSLLANRLNDESCPSATTGAGEDASDGSVDGVEPGV